MKVSCLIPQLHRRACQGRWWEAEEGRCSLCLILWGWRDETGWGWCRRVCRQLSVRARVAASLCAWTQEHREVTHAECMTGEVGSQHSRAALQHWGSDTPTGSLASRGGGNLSLLLAKPQPKLCSRRRGKAAPACTGEDTTHHPWCLLCQQPHAPNWRGHGYQNP